MGAVESKTMVEYLGEHDKQNYEYYSGERFVLIQHTSIHRHQTPKKKTTDIRGTAGIGSDHSRYLCLSSASVIFFNRPNRS